MKLRLIFHWQKTKLTFCIQESRSKQPIHRSMSLQHFTIEIHFAQKKKKKKKKKTLYFICWSQKPISSQRTYKTSAKIPRYCSLLVKVNIYSQIPYQSEMSKCRLQNYYDSWHTAKTNVIICSINTLVLLLVARRTNQSSFLHSNLVCLVACFGLLASNRKSVSVHRHLSSNFYDLCTVCVCNKLLFESVGFKFFASWELTGVVSYSKCACACLNNYAISIVSNL